MKFQWQMFKGKHHILELISVCNISQNIISVQEYELFTICIDVLITGLYPADDARM